LIIRSPKVGILNVIDEAIAQAINDITDKNALN
jgi:hypothetical protein